MTTWRIEWLVPAKYSRNYTAFWDNITEGVTHDSKTAAQAAFEDTKAETPNLRFRLVEIQETVIEEWPA